MPSVERPRAPRRRFALIALSAFLLCGLGIEALTRAGVSPWLAQLPVILGGVTYTWALNRRFTFGVRSPPTAGEYLRYLAASGVGLAVNVAGSSLCLALGAPPLAAIGGGAVAGMIVNWLGYSRLVYRADRDTSAQRSK